MIHRQSQHSNFVSLLSIMSESTPAVELTDFSDAELTQLRKDDVFAGKFIGRTLVLMFLYSAIILSGVVWWTHSTVSERAEPENATQAVSGEL